MLSERELLERELYEARRVALERAQNDLLAGLGPLAAVGKRTRRFSKRSKPVGHCSRLAIFAQPSRVIQQPATGGTVEFENDEAAQRSCQRHFWIREFTFRQFGRWRIVQRSP